MRFIYTYILKLRLAAIFKAAEENTARGVQPGNEAYVFLFADAQTLIHKHQRKYPKFDVQVEVPALDQLAKLTVPLPPPNFKKGIAIGLLGGLGTFIVIGGMAAAINVSYHGWLYLFHLAHLGR